MQIECPSCELIVEVNALQLMDDGITRCPECKNQITMDDLDPEIFSDMDTGTRGGYKSGADLLSSEFDL
jgi:hypothetical protein